MNGMALCAGIGGLELGLRLAVPEYRCVCYVEREAYCVETLVRRMREGRLDLGPVWDDLKTFDGEPWRGIVDLISSGFPCQPWSTAGLKKGTKDKRWIWPDIERVIRQVEPEWVFLENVPGLIKGGISQILGGLATFGFDAEWDVFSAAGVGAPHIRKRVFILAHSRRSYGREGTKEQGSIRGMSKNGSVKDKLKRSSKTQEFSNPEKVRCGEGGLPIRETPAFSLFERCSWWETEPVLGRVVDRVANRMDRLRAIGNGVVPAVACKAWKVLYGRLIDDNDGHS